MDSLSKIVIPLGRTCSAVDVILAGVSFFASLMIPSSAEVATSIATPIDFFHEALLCFHPMAARWLSIGFARKHSSSSYSVTDPNLACLCIVRG